MRLGLISDVHANRHALEAVLAALDRERPDAVVCAGDLVGYGPEPDACVEAVLARVQACVSGNHDLIATGRLSEDRCVRLARTSLRWTRDELGEPARERLLALPPVATAAGGSVVVAHGSLDDPQRYVLSAEDAAEQLGAVGRRHPEAAVLALGHTHQPLAVGERRGELLRGRTGTVELEPGERLLVNPGAVGQSREREPLARFAVLDLGAGAVTFRAVPYDVRGVRRELRRRGLPAASCHQPPTALRRARSLAGRARTLLAR